MLDHFPRSSPRSSSEVGEAPATGVSIPSNIAEGSGYGLNKRYVHHLRIARGSEAELQTQLELAGRLKFATAEQVRATNAKASEVGRMLNGLISSLSPKI